MQSIKKIYFHENEIVGRLVKYETSGYIIKVYSEEGNITNVIAEPKNPLLQPEITLYEGTDARVSFSGMIDIKYEQIDKVINSLHEAKELLHYLKEHLHSLKEGIIP